MKNSCHWPESICRCVEGLREKKLPYSPKNYDENWNYTVGQNKGGEISDEEDSDSLDASSNDDSDD